MDAAKMTATSSARSGVAGDGDGLICGACQNEIREDASFCHACGCRVSQMVDAAASSTSDPTAAFPGPTPPPTPPTAPLSGAAPGDPTVALPAGAAGASDPGSDPSAATVLTPAPPGSRDRRPGSGHPGPLELGSDALLGRRVAGCLVQDKIGQGGMGAVYRAIHEALDKEVVVKTLPAMALADETLVARFLREARAAAKLEHPNVVGILNVVREPAGCFIVMQYIRGESLQDRIDREGAIPWTEATAVILDAARGLAAAHRRGIIHRDIKPANIMIDAEEGTGKLADFGLARDSDSGEKLSVTGQILGTPPYMPPEYGLSETIDARADIYSLGISYYQALTGKLPYRASSVFEYLRKHLTETPTPVTSICAGVPPSVRNVVDRAMAKRREDRYADAASLVADLERVLREESVAAPASPHAPRSAEAAAFVAPPPSGVGSTDAGGHAGTVALPPQAEAALAGAPAGKRPRVVLTAGLSGCTVMLLAVIVAFPILFGVTGPEGDRAPLSTARGPSAADAIVADDAAGAASAAGASKSKVQGPASALPPGGRRATAVESPGPGAATTGATDDAPPGPTPELVEPAGDLLPEADGATPSPPPQRPDADADAGAGAGAGSPREWPPGVVVPNSADPLKLPVGGGEHRDDLKAIEGMTFSAGPPKKEAENDEPADSAGDGTRRRQARPSVTFHELPAEITTTVAGGSIMVKGRIVGLASADIAQAWLSGELRSVRAYLRDEPDEDGTPGVELLGELFLTEGDNEVTILVVRSDGREPVRVVATIRYAPE